MSKKLLPKPAQPGLMKRGAKKGRRKHATQRDGKQPAPAVEINEQVFMRLLSAEERSYLNGQKKIDERITIKINGIRLNEFNKAFNDD
ncbi:MAG: hypothetical protein JRN26_05610 [Nitrososphaerota archaeon]|jgi:transposase|nr:hypothetical protein [Nitrososphaerota archaeon]MDG6927202.1 hypothetical protein [Nitrososphaerota archaeon]MDG6930810.1 hypothetical protein [Nitrososphaerota archaeon]MDG6932254.1 hypothetical protein [Nitrososphaerota archaeon]MDG6936341.1 hypothetical protein [Nitrososphaerota archaeon]